MINILNLTNKNLLDHKQMFKNRINKEMLTESILLLIVCHMNHRTKIIKIHANLITIMNNNIKIIIKINNPL